MKMRVKKSRDYRPHSLALHGAGVLVQLSQEQRSGHFYQWMGSLLLSAFAFEGYLNFLGRVFFPSWESFEKSMSWHAKVKLLGDRTGSILNEGKEPFQTLKKLFRFRDQVAHPKPELLSEDRQLDEKEAQTPFAAYAHVKSEVEDFCNEKNAKHCIEMVEKAMDAIYHQAYAKFKVENPQRHESFILNAWFYPGGQSGSAHSGS